MATILKKFAFTRGRGRTPKYPWDDWLDGQIWRLQKGQDFDCDAGVLRNQAYLAAQKKGVSVQTALVLSDDGQTIEALIIQAF